MPWSNAWRGAAVHGNNRGQSRQEPRHRRRRRRLRGGHSPHRRLRRLSRHQCLVAEHAGFAGPAAPGEPRSVAHAVCLRAREESRRPSAAAGQDCARSTIGRTRRHRVGRSGGRDRRPRSYRTRQWSGRPGSSAAMQGSGRAQRAAALRRLDGSACRHVSFDRGPVAADRRRRCRQCSDAYAENPCGRLSRAAVYGSGLRRSLRLVTEIKRGLAELLRADGFTSIAEAVGAGHGARRRPAPQTAQRGGSAVLIELSAAATAVVAVAPRRVDQLFELALRLADADVQRGSRRASAIRARWSYLAASRRR